MAPTFPLSVPVLDIGLPLAKAGNSLDYPDTTSRYLVVAMQAMGCSPADQSLFGSATRIWRCRRECLESNQRCLNYQIKEDKEDEELNVVEVGMYR